MIKNNPIFIDEIERRLNQFRKHRIGNTIHVIRNGCCIKGTIIMLDAILLRIVLTYTKIDGSKTDLTIQF